LGKRLGNIPLAQAIAYQTGNIKEGRLPRAICANDDGELGNIHTDVFKAAVMICLYPGEH
jgi:hypothetical protein